MEKNYKAPRLEIFAFEAEEIISNSIIVPDMYGIEDGGEAY